jgi:hypothetical protein
LILFLIPTINAQTPNSIWRDDLTYANFEQFQNAGWTTTYQPGVTFSTDGVILDATTTDTSISYSNHFQGTYDWTVEDRSRWTIGPHSGNSIFAQTQLHTYGFAADGWYNNYALYRDNQKILTFGNYQEQQNQWFTLKMEKHGNQIDMFYNGVLQNSYTETDPTPSQLLGVSINAPWQGGAEYDYAQVWSTNTNSATTNPPNSDVAKTAWIPTPTSGAEASIFAIIAVGITSAIITAATTVSTGAASGFIGKIIDKLRELIPETLKKWLEDFISSKRKLKIDEKTGSPYLPTKAEIILYTISIILSTFAFSYVKITSIQDLLIILPTFFATSILVSFARTYILSTYSRRKGVWTENKLWYFGLGLFLFTTIAFKTPFSSATRTVHHSRAFTEKLAGFLSTAGILITLTFGALFYIIYKSGFTLIGGTGLAMCLISAFFDTFPIEPMGGKDIYKYNKKIWILTFTSTLLLYIGWITQII